MSIRVPAVPRLFPLPGGSFDIRPVDLRVRRQEPLRDEYGLLLSVYGEYPDPARRLISIALRELGLSRDNPPGYGSIAEIVVFGLLMDHGVEYRQGVLGGANNFTFQSYELGGRNPGGSVVDFMVYLRGERIACRVQSVFHDLVNPFGLGGQVTQRDANLALALKASVFIDRIIDVNRSPQRVLETSGNVQDYEREFLRIRGVVS